MVKLDSIWQRRKEVAVERMKICVDCDRYNSTTTQCNECGCFMLVKTTFANSVCPLKKWGKDVDEDKTK